MKIMQGFLALILIQSSPVFAGSHSHSHDDSDHKHYTTEEIMEIAMSAAPANVSGNATIMGSDGSILKAGNNGWVCMPGTPPNENVNPMCVDPAWQNWLQEYMKAVNGQAYEYDSECLNMELYTIHDPRSNYSEHWMTNCYPDQVFYQNEQTALSLLKAIKDL